MRRWLSFPFLACNTTKECPNYYDKRRAFFVAFLPRYEEVPMYNVGSRFAPVQHVPQEAHHSDAVSVQGYSVRQGVQCTARTESARLPKHLLTVASTSPRIFPRVPCAVAHIAATVHTAT
jgi:hypothetical protein